MYAVVKLVDGSEIAGALSWEALTNGAWSVDAQGAPRLWCVDVPETDRQLGFTRYLPAASVLAITPVAKQDARNVAAYLGLAQVPRSRVDMTATIKGFASLYEPGVMATEQVSTDGPDLEELDAMNKAYDESRWASALMKTLPVFVGIARVPDAGLDVAVIAAAGQTLMDERYPNEHQIDHVDRCEALFAQVIEGRAVVIWAQADVTCLASESVPLARWLGRADKLIFLDRHWVEYNGAPISLDDAALAAPLEPDTRPGLALACARRTRAALIRMADAWDIPF